MPERRQFHPVVSPDAGLVTGEPKHAIPDRGWTTVKNARFREGKAQKVPGFIETQAAALDGQVMGLYDFQTTGGFQAWIAVTPTKVYKKTPTDATFVDITGTALTGNTTEWADFTTFKDLLIIVNGRDAPRKWDGVAATTSNLGGTPPVARRVTTFQNHVVLGWIDPNAVTPSPQKIQWSDLGLAEVWSGGEAGSLSFVDEPSGVLEIMPLRDSLVAYKADAGYLVDYTGFPFTMSSRRMFTGTGPISARMVSAVRDAHYFVGNDANVYRLTLSGPEPIGEPIRVGMFNELSYKRRDRAFQFVNESLNEAYFCIPVGADNFPTICYILNYVEGKWGRRELSATAAAPNGAAQLTDITWDGSSGSWDLQTETWDSTRQTAGAPLNLHGDTAGKVYKHSSGENNANGVAIDCEIDSKMFDFGAPGKKKRVSRVQITYDLQSGTTLTMFVLTASGPELTPTVSSAFTIVLDGSGDQWIDMDLTAVYFGFRFKNNSLNQPFAITGYMPEYFVREET